MKAQSRRRLFAESEESTRLSLPSDCELVAGTFVVFKWEHSYCMLQVNVTLYCWGRRRSGAIEHVLAKYDLSQSPQLHRVNSKLVSTAQWNWLKQVFLVVHRLFDDSEMCDSVAKVRWINIMQCELVYDVMRRECHHYHRNLYPKGSVLTSFLKQHGVEVEPWYDSLHTVDSSDRRSPSPMVNRSSPWSSGSGGSSGSDAVNAANAIGDVAENIGVQVWADREWLSDVHIANIMFLLLHGQLAIPMEHRDLFQCVYPLTDQLFEHMLYRSDQGSLLMHAKVDRGVTLAFVNPNSSHWRLIVLDGLHQQVVLFDPLGVSLPTALTRAIRELVGPEYRMTVARSCLQAEGWNCGIWALYIASKYVNAVVERVSSSSGQASSSSIFHFQLWDEGDEYVVLNAESTSRQRSRNRAFAGELRKQYATLLADATENGRLLYSADEGGIMDDNEMVVDEIQPATETTTTMGVVKAGSAFSVVRHRRFIDRPLAELVWIDLTDGMGTVEVSQEEEVVASFDDLCDQFIEFREDNVNNSCAAALRYSLPGKLQSDVLKEQIEDFRVYRRQRFSLFRKGPLVEESTVSSNISALLRFLGYLYYQQASTLETASLDMSVFTLPNINVLVLNYVEWLEQRRGSKARPADDTSFQPVSCATVANYLNGLVSIVKFQLRHDIHLRDSLLDQLRNLRSQAESYSMSQKKFEKVHPQWCSWQELQVARERCRATFDQLPESKQDNATYLLHLRELCLLGFFTICPPPRCSIVRLLEWNKTLVRDVNGRWVIDLTDLSHAATRHKTHKHKGAMLLPLPQSLDSYLALLRRLTPRGEGAVFAASRRTSPSSSLSSASCMGPTVFTSFVKQTFSEYTDGGKGPNPSLLRSIFTTWLYGLRYDTEDAFLQEIKASSAKWKAHSEQMAATVYNKDIIYQQKAFRQLLVFCESYSERFAYNRRPTEERTVPETRQNAGKVERNGRTKSSRKRNRELEVHSADRTEPRTEENEYVVEALLDVRMNKDGEKQVQVEWEGYHRTTWEPYSSMKQQLPDMLAKLEDDLARADDEEEEEEEKDDSQENIVHAFLVEYIVTHKVDKRYRWHSDRLNALEMAAEGHCPRIKRTEKELRKKIMRLVNEAK